MGWQCGQLYSYGKWYWEDPNVAECRKFEARSVCQDLFEVTLPAGAEDHSTAISQDNTGLNLLEFNIFGESHGVSHAGFFLFLFVLLALAALFCICWRGFKVWAARHISTPPTAPRRPSREWQGDWRAESSVRPSNRGQPCAIQIDPYDLVAAFRHGGIRPHPDRRFTEANIPMSSLGEEEAAEASVAPRVGPLRVKDTPTV